jgi:hypothetical protein
MDVLFLMNRGRFVAVLKTVITNKEITMIGSGLKQRLKRLKKDSLCCHCGEPLTIETSTLEHIIPRVLGGGSGNNLTLACGPCNWDRGSMDFMVYQTLKRGDDVEDVLWMNRDWYEGHGDYQFGGKVSISDEEPLSAAELACRSLKALRNKPEKKITPVKSNPRPRGQKFKQLIREKNKEKALRINCKPLRPMASAMLHAFMGPLN